MIITHRSSSGGITTLVLDLSDEAVEGADPRACVLTARVAGDAESYIQSLADDFRRNNPSLFPLPEAAVESDPEGV